MTTTRENIDRLLAERARDWEATGKPLADIAATREFNAEEGQTWARVNAAFDAASARIKTLELSEDQERQIAEFRESVGSDDALSTAIANEIRAVLLGDQRGGADFAFTTREFKRALTSTTAASGGNTVPATFWAELIRPLRDFSSILQAGATIITTASGEEITMPTLASAGTAAQTAESIALSGTDPTFGKASLKSYKLGEVVLAPRELIEDSAVDIESLIATLIGENIGVLLGQRLAVGTGTGQTAGLATAATTGKTGAAYAATFDDLIDLFFSVGAPYRTRASFIVADQAFASLRKIKGSDGQYVWQPSVQQGQPDLILGKPAFADANLAAPTNGAKSVLFGDVSKYWVRYVNTLRFERSDHAAFTNDQVAFKGTLRADGVLTDASAVKAFAGLA
ncbi:MULTISPECIES: phage major capsid protein [unclassified Cryobacterium]|uniref:phage major capsid protein n=1 Tax=unclassified Cryobacterium TaxID=2649013 RepID=UPI002AB4DB75|nr:MULTISPECIES: phage major capsid protein [unclassified Cryobacterium]MDY7528457.1 phage major capsid protein [Cryobacterium sp. 10C2]MDY7555798.1 phage major capsid protein [Cryobacterium sp. 10C3]MEB0289177.1 phage major capsid protein [Cryobacterium sp. 10C2]